MPAGFCDYPPSEGLRSLNPARPLFLKEIWLKKVTFSTYYHKTLDIATSKRVDGRYFTTKKLKFEVVIPKVAIYVLTEVRHGPAGR